MFCWSKPQKYPAGNILLVKVSACVCVPPLGGAFAQHESPGTAVLKTAVLKLLPSLLIQPLLAGIQKSQISLKTYETYESSAENLQNTSLHFVSPASRRLIFTQLHTSKMFVEYLIKLQFNQTKHSVSVIFADF